MSRSRPALTFLPVAVLTATLAAGMTVAPTPASADDLPPETAHTLVATTGDPVDGWYTGPVEVHLQATDAGGDVPITTEFSVDGGPWRAVDHPTEVIFDGTQESFDRWRMAPGGEFVLLPDGTMMTTGGLGMLWYPVRDWGDMELNVRWRDAKPDRPAGIGLGPFTSGSNAGVFVRFPNPDDAAQGLTSHGCAEGETRPAWVAIFCGHEIQINDRIDGDPKKTGSVYNFADIGLDQAQPTARGEWNDYTVRTVGDGDYEITVVRNGEIINRWRNDPGQQPQRAGDPGTDLRQFERGYVGLQNHGAEDYIQYGEVSVTDLEALEPITVRGDGEHTVRYRSTDAAGNVEQVRTVHLRIDSQAPSAAADTDGSAVTITAVDTSRGAGVAAVETRVDGGDWVAHDPAQVLFDGTQEMLDRWTMSGPGAFTLTGEEDAMRTEGGLGLLWWPEDTFGDATFTFEWREGFEDGTHSNGGAFIRFPDPDAAVYYTSGQQHPCQAGLGLLLAEWVAVNCGHEVQVNDGDIDPKQTGSVYNFADLNGPRATHPNQFGEWNRYEIRTVGDGDYDVTVTRNGHVLNRWRNSPGQRPARAFDPPTDVRQFAEGHFGLQNHGSADNLWYRDVRVLDLGPIDVTIDVPAGSTVEYRVRDRAGNTSAIRQVTTG